MKHATTRFRPLAAVGAGLLLLLAPLRPAAAQTWVELTPEGGGPSAPISWRLGGAGYDAVNNRLITYFPSNPGFRADPLPEVWVLTNANGLGDTPVWIQLAPEGTPPTNIRGSPGTVYDAASNRLIVYGGCYANCSPAQSTVYVLTHANGLGGTPTWTMSAVKNPQARVTHSMVFDPSSNRIITFGGHFAFPGTDQNDTRILTNANGVGSPSTWRSLTTAGPLPGRRGVHTAIYDQTNNRMTIFGGMENQSSLSVALYNDVWVLTNANGSGGASQWIQLTPAESLPKGRLFHSAVYDSLHNRLLMFGGLVSERPSTHYVLDDLWELSHANGLGGRPTWTPLSPSGTPPGPNYQHAAVFDAAHQRMIIFGGVSESGRAHKRVWVLVL